MSVDLERTIRECIAYCPRMGILTWKKIRTKNHVTLGDQVGHATKKGYLRFLTCGRKVLVHRACWLLYYGQWPNGEIDHINGIKDDNRIINLRDVSGFVNQQNRKQQNPSGVVGVTWDKQRLKWFAKITKGKKQIALGRYYDVADAIRARKAAEVLHYGSEGGV